MKGYTEQEQKAIDRYKKEKENKVIKNIGLAANAVCYLLMAYGQGAISFILLMAAIKAGKTSSPGAILAVLGIVAFVTALYFGHLYYVEFEKNGTPKHNPQ